MKNAALLAASLLLAGPAFAQDDGGGEGTGQSMSELLEQTADDPTSADSYAAESEDAGGYDDPWGSSEPSPAPKRRKLYVGADYVSTRASLSNPDLIAEFGDTRLDSTMYRARLGVRLLERIGLELQYGGSDEELRELESDAYLTEQFYAIYLVPTGVLFDFLEVGAAIGYASTELRRPGAEERLKGASYGINLEVPLLMRESMELRLASGGTVYRAHNSARVYGYHAGLRIDFRL